jgi:hypothetical protein
LVWRHRIEGHNARLRSGGHSRQEAAFEEFSASNVIASAIVSFNSSELA